MPKIAHKNFSGPFVEFLLDYFIDFFKLDFFPVVHKSALGTAFDNCILQSVHMIILCRLLFC